MAIRIHWRFWERGRGDCAAVEPLLSLLADDMASAAEARRAEAHLQDCADCRRALQWMQATRQVIVARPVAAPPPELRARIARAIAELEAARSPAVVPARPAHRPRALRPALAYGLSFALLAVLGGDVIWNAQKHTQIAVGPVPRHITVAGNVPPVHIGLPKVHSQRTHALVADRHTPSPRPLVHHHAASAAVPDLTASRDIGRTTTPSPLTSLKAAPRLRPARHGASHATTLLASTVPAVSPRLPHVKPLRPEPSAAHDGVKVARLPSPAPLPGVPAPTVRVLPPTVTPDQPRVASLSSPSINDTLRGIALSFQRRAALTSRAVAANSRTVARTVAFDSTDSSGTVPFVRGPVR